MSGRLFPSAEFLPAGCAVAGMLAGLVALACLGCGESVAQVTGQVKSGGQPVAGVQLAFETEAEPKQAYFGGSFEEGKYILDLAGRPGLVPGKYTIKASDWTLPSGGRLPPGEQGEALKSEGKAVGRVYVFHRDIAAGTNVVDLALDQAESVETLSP